MTVKARALCASIVKINVSLKCTALNIPLSFPPLLSFTPFYFLVVSMTTRVFLVDCNYSATVRQQINVIALQELRVYLHFVLNVLGQILCLL